MAAKKDYYRTLGVGENASADEIKRAYRRLAKKYHPDATGGDKAKEAKFKEITEAYETVGDEKKRSAYDVERKNPFAGGVPPGAGGPFPGGFRGGAWRTTPGGGRANIDVEELFNRHEREGGGGGFGDLFSELFGGATRTRTAAKGADVHARLEIELPTAAHGGDVPIVVDGKKLTVKVPAGVDDGQTIRVTGQGQPGKAGAGDLLLEVHVKPHAQFRRHAADLEVDLPLTIDQAVLGAKVDVPTLEGRVQLTVPPSTSSGLKMRLRGKGVPKRDGTRGDLYAVTQIVVPKEVPPKAKELISEFTKLTRK